MNAIDRAWRALRRVDGAVLLLTVCFITACASESASDARSGDCSGPACAANSAAIDWRSQAPTFMAQLRVVDAMGAAVVGANLRLGSAQALTDARGLAQLGPVDALKPASLRIDKQGLTPQVTVVSATSAAQQRQTVVLSPVGVSRELKMSERSVIANSGARVELAERTLASADGARASKARIELTYLPASTLTTLSPAAHAAIDESGRPTMIGRNLGTIFARFQGSGEVPLNLAVGTTATVELPIAADAGVKDGDVLPLWALDELRGTWKRESSCLVASHAGAAGVEQFCLGRVDHFSWWRVGPEVKIYDAGTVGCVYGHVTTDETAPCWDLDALFTYAYRCNKDGEACLSAQTQGEKLDLGWQDARYCGLTPIDDPEATYRILVTYRAKTDRCGADAPKYGLRKKLSAPVSVASFRELLGAEVMLNFTLAPGRDCAKLCVPIAVNLNLSDLKDPRWTDRDDDGWLATSDENPLTAFGSDCNDDDAKRYPGAPEPPCVYEDRNCDGRTHAKVESYAELPWWEWNAACKTCNAMLPLGDEVPLNEFDENCDGLVQDRDGDSFSEPSDCNDRNALVSPMASEKDGNAYDENCDGIYLDVDGDHYYNPKDKLAISLPTYLDKTRFTDCNDEDPRTHPAADPLAERGALQSFYYQTDGVSRRSPWFCNLFDERGKPSEYYRAVIRDLNCDGSVLDHDGDGFMAPDDCDDRDPRIFPTGEGFFRTCVVRGDLANDSVCDLQSRDTVEGCPVLTFGNAEVVTVCEELKKQDGTGTGTGGCNFAGWHQSNPLVPSPGVSWGPCDGDGPLPDCPPGARCGGPLPYSSAMLDYLKRDYLSGAEPYFAGMCFPACELAPK